MEFEYFPGTHDVHTSFDFEPSWVKYPAGHVVHFVDSISSEYLPGSHSSQVLPSSELRYRPGAQRHTFAAPDASQTMPASTVHDVALASAQTHEAEEECGAEPSWWSHARAVTAHRHPISVPPRKTPQLIEESFLGLIIRADPR